MSAACDLAIESCQSADESRRRLAELDTPTFIHSKPLPPFGRRFLQAQPSAGPWVAIGADSWAFAESKPFPVMTLPPGEDPEAYSWPVEGLDVLLVEWGSHDTDYLERVALALLRAGAKFVQPLRESRLANWQDQHNYCWEVADV